MARIPISKYPNQAGYTVLNTDTNTLEVLSDGIYKPIGGEPEFENSINIYVGPGGDYATVDEAFSYINSIKPKLSTSNWVDAPTINLIFKTGYTFTQRIPIFNQFMPWLTITQEDINTPLNVNFTEYAGVINLFKSVIGEINLNLYNPNSYKTALALQVSSNSYIDKVSLTAENMRTGITMRNSEIRHINKLVLNKMSDYGLVMMYNCYAQVTADVTLLINDVGRTNAGLGYAIHVNDSNLRLYRATNYSINNAKRALNIMEQGQIIISEGTLNIDNCDYGIYFTSNGGKIVYSTANISFGTGVTTNWYPTSIVKNTWNSSGIIID